MQTLEQLRRRARKHGLLIHKYTRGEDAFIIVDARINGVVSYPIPLTLEQVEEWFDDYEREDDEPTADNN